MTGGGLSLPISDKVVHLGLYTVLGVALAYVRFRGVRTIPHLVMITIGALYGVSDEWHQSFVPGRSPSAADWGADVAGVVIGYGLLMLLVNRLARRTGRAEPKESTT